MERCSKENVGCQCVRCKRVYHISCNQDQTTLTNDSAKKWICQPCEFQKNLKVWLDAQDSTIKKIPEMIASEVESHFGKLNDELKASIEPINMNMKNIEKDVCQVKEDNFHLQSLECRRDIIIDGIPSNIKEPKALRELIIKIGSVYNVAVKSEEIYQCIRLKKNNRVLIKFGNLITKEDVMKAYFRTKNLRLNQIVDTNVESRVFLNNNFPNQIQRSILYCRRLKKLNLISNYTVNFTTGKCTVISNENSTLNYAGFEELAKNHKFNSTEADESSH